MTEEEKNVIRTPLSSIMVLRFQPTKNYKLFENCELLFKVMFKTIASGFMWNPQQKILAISFESGDMHMFKLNFMEPNVQPDAINTVFNANAKIVWSDEGRFKPHTKKITGIEIDSAKGLVWTISHDKYLRAHELTSKNKRAEVLIDDSKLTSIHIYEPDYIFVGSESGILACVSLNPENP